MASARGIRAGSAFVEIFTDDSKLVRGLKNAGKKLKAFGDAITGWGRKMTAAGAAVTAPMIGAAKGFADMGSRMWDMSKRTGMSVEALSSLGYAAEQTGTDMEAFEGGVRRMQRTIHDAGQGMNSATEALAELGLGVADLANLSPEEQFKLLADRLDQIKDPTQKAAVALMIFGRSGTQLLPMLEGGAAALEACQKRARELGLVMSTEDAAAADAFGDALDDLWKVLKMAVFAIGSALAPTLKAVSEWIIRTVVTTTAWIKENKDLVVTILKVAAAVLAGGVALMALGYAITTIGAVMSALAGIIAGVGTALGVMGSIIAALVTPIGLVIAAIAALGAYLIYVSDMGGQALQWLGDRFADLSDFASESFQGISDALVAGDIALAAKILWLSLKVIWQKGVLELTRLWETLKGAGIKIVYGLWYGVQAAWEIGVASISEVMLKLYYGIMRTWESLSTGVMNVWDSTVNWVAKRIIDLQGLMDDSIDTDAVKEALDKDASASIANRNEAKKASQARIAQERDAALKMLGQEHEQKMARIGQDASDAENQLDAEAKKKVDAAQGELDAAKKEWQEAIGQARQKRGMKEAEGEGGPQRLQAPPEIPDYLEGLGPTIEDAQKKTIGVAGSFNAMEARGLGAGGVTDRIAKASEETARNTKKLVQEAQMGQLAFE